MSHSIDKGSQIAKDGFKNEDEVVENSIIGKLIQNLNNGLKRLAMI